MLNNETYLCFKDLIGYENQCFSSDHFMLLQNHSWVNDYCTLFSVQKGSINCNAVECEKFDNMVLNATLQQIFKK